MISKFIDKINKAQQRSKPISAPVGSTVHVHVKIKEGDKERVQVFTGTVLARKGRAGTETFMVRRVSHGVGVERIFPVNSPSVVKVDIEKGGHVRRAKLYYLRSLGGKKGRLKEEFQREEAAVAAPAPAQAKPATT